jgi:hypothetical protein
MKALMGKRSGQSAGGFQAKALRKYFWAVLDFHSGTLKSYWMDKAKFMHHQGDKGTPRKSLGGFPSLILSVLGG